MSQLLSNTTSLQEVLNTLQNKAVNGEQATPEISINTLNGLITAIAGSKSSTHQLAFQAAKTITPSATSQIAVSSGYYTGGNITVAAVPTQSKSVTPTTSSQNITPDSGKFISRVTVNAIPSQYIVPSGTSTITSNGTYDVKNYASATINVESSGGGEAAEWSEAEDAIVNGAISIYSNDRVTSIRDSAFTNCSSLTSVSFPNVTLMGSYAFAFCTSLTSVSFPKVTSIRNSAFHYCSSLTSVSFPKATTLMGYAFYYCSSLISVSFPKATSIGSYAFAKCSSLISVSFPKATSISSRAFYNCCSLTSISFPNVTSISSGAFYSCYNLTTLHLMGSSVCTLSHSNAFTSTPIGGYSASAGTYGSIYVPMSLLASYQAATNWTYFSSRFVGVDGGTDSPNLISFTIVGDKTYQAEEDMLWSSWVDSDYNTGGYYVSQGIVYNSKGLQLRAGLKIVLASATVIATTYEIAGMGGEN